MKTTNRERLNSIKMKVNAVSYLAENNNPSKELYSMIMRFLYEIEEETKALTRIAEKESEFNLNFESEED